MIPQSISLIFFLVASAFSVGLIVVSVWVKALQPNSKRHVFIMLVSCVLAALAGVFLHQSGFYINLEIGFK